MEKLHLRADPAPQVPWPTKRYVEIEKGCRFRQFVVSVMEPETRPNTRNIAPNRDDYGRDVDGYAVTGDPSSELVLWKLRYLQPFVRSTNPSRTNSTNTDSIDALNTSGTKDCLSTRRAVPTSSGDAGARCSFIRMLAISLARGASTWVSPVRRSYARHSCSQSGDKTHRPLSGTKYRGVKALLAYADHGHVMPL
mgnify:CR=1 FL=1